MHIFKPKYKKSNFVSPCKFLKHNINKIQNIKMKTNRIIIIFIFSVFFCSAKAQQLGDNAQISLLTCGAGNELYSIFGHCAIRVCDEENNLDVVFNYGTFDFSTENFYLKFSRGTLMYMLSACNFDDFLESYKRENRSVYEQKLNISSSEKQKLFDLLIENYKPQNRNYRYDFFKDNCATRIRDILQKTLGEKLDFSNQNTQGNHTFRQLIYPYLEKMQWSKLGIDILLGIPTDAKATNADYMFLPDELMKNVDTAKIDGQNLGTKPEIIYMQRDVEVSVPLSPNMVFSIFMFITVLLSCFEFYRLKQNKKFNIKIFDRLFFVIMALLSLVILFLWFFSLHYPVRPNLNILWLNPLYFYVCIKLSKTNIYVLLACIACNLAVLCLQYFLPQHFNTAFFAIIIAATIRLAMLVAVKLHLRRDKKTNYL